MTTWQLGEAQVDSNVESLVFPRSIPRRVHDYLVAAGWKPTEDGHFWRDYLNTTLQLQTLDAFGIQSARDAAGLTP